MLAEWSHVDGSSSEMIAESTSKTPCAFPSKAAGAAAAGTHRDEVTTRGRWGALGATRVALCTCSCKGLRAGAGAALHRRALGRDQERQLHGRPSWLSIHAPMMHQEWMGHSRRRLRKPVWPSAHTPGRHRERTGYPRVDSGSRQYVSGA